MEQITPHPAKKRMCEIYQDFQDSTMFLQSLARKSPQDEGAQLRVQRAKRLTEAFREFEIDASRRTKDLLRHGRNKLGSVLYVDSIDEASEENSENGEFDTVERARSLSTLPPEIYDCILGFVNTFCPVSRNRTLLAIMCSCRMLQLLAEPYLYGRVSFADQEFPVEQWRFGFTLAVNPRISNLVTELQLYWAPDCMNAELLMEIVLGAPNCRELKIDRGPQSAYELSYVPQAGPTKDVVYLELMLSAFDKLASFHFGTCLNSADFKPIWRYKLNAAYEERTFKPSNHPLLKSVAHGLVVLLLDTSPVWLETALLLHVSPKLRKLRLRTGFSMGTLPLSADLLLRLHLQSPLLQDLSITSSVLQPSEVGQMIQSWRGTLRRLFVDLRDGWNRSRSEWMERYLLGMRVLEDLDLGQDCECSIRTFSIVVHSLPPGFRRLSVRHLEEPYSHLELSQTDSTSGTRAEQSRALCHLLQTHSSTLEALELLGGELVGREIFQKCREAPRLSSLWVHPMPDVTTSDIDAIIEACPKLRRLHPELVKLSSHSKELRKSGAYFQEELEREERAKEKSLYQNSQRSLHI